MIPLARRARQHPLISSQRKFTMPSLFAISKVIAASVTIAGASFVTWRKYQLHPTRQSTFVKNKIQQKFESHDVPGSLKRQTRHTRVVETLFLKNFLNSAPTGPLLILGPAGAGQSVLIKEVAHGLCCIFLDFKKTPVSTGEELVHMLCEHAGYQFEVSTLVSRFLLREGPRNNRLTPQEADVALSLLSQVLLDQKEKGWPLGIPVICFDDIFSIFGDTTFVKDAYFKKFTDWCVHLYDSKLAHVVFVSSHPMMSEWKLNGITPLKHRRTLVYINFPSSASVHKYLTDEFEILRPQLEEEKKAVPNQVQIDWIDKCFGGHMEDLDHAVSALVRGETFTTVLQRMISESINFVEGYMEGIIKDAAAAGGPEAKAATLEKYLRFWRMLEVLRDSEYVNRRDVANSIFKDYVVELDQYAQMEIVCYLTRGARPDLGETEFVKVDMEEESQYDKQSTDRSLTSIVRIDPDVNNGEKKKMKEERERFMLLGEGLGGWIVSAGSARLRIAFDNVLKHPRLVKQRKRIENYLNLKTSRDKQTKLIAEKNEVMEEKKMYMEELASLMKDEVVYKSCLGEEKFAERIARAAHTEEILQGRLVVIEQELFKLSQNIITLEHKLEEVYEFE